MSQLNRKCGRLGSIHLNHPDNVLIYDVLQLENIPTVCSLGLVFEVHLTHGFHRASSPLSLPNLIDSCLRPEAPADVVIITPVNLAGAHASLVFPVCVLIVGTLNDLGSGGEAEVVSFTGPVCGSFMWNLKS